jgi:adenylyl- and sulfurtransferase ThiI
MALLHTLTKALQTAQCTMKTFSVISRLDWHMNSNDLEKEFGELVVTHKDQQERVNDEDDY